MRDDTTAPASVSQNAGKATGRDDDQRAALPRRVDAYALRCVLGAAEPDRLSEAFLLLRVEGRSQVPGCGVTRRQDRRLLRPR